ncbi:MAG: phosphoribosyltransferase [Thaumarchaeota archaeon]|nr:MAG: phosphoribosyltransferase [Nitrososphaerota archaeon]
MIFNRIIDRFQLKFKDREDAGNILGESLENLINKKERNNSLVLGIPRGGVIIGWTIANKLSCDFGIIIPRKLHAPNNQELAIGALMEDGTTYLNETLVKELDISPEYIKKEKLDQLEEIRRRTQLYSGKTFNWNQNDLSGKTVILGDDGAATGATLIVAARYIKTNKNPRKLIIAIPISPKGTINALKNEDIDQIEVITSPQNRNFLSIEQYYQNFDQVTDKQVIDTIQRNLK